MEMLNPGNKRIKLFRPTPLGIRKLFPAPRHLARGLAVITLSAIIHFPPAKAADSAGDSSPEELFTAALEAISSYRETGGGGRNELRRPGKLRAVPPDILAFLSGEEPEHVAAFASAAESILQRLMENPTKFPPETSFGWKLDIARFFDDRLKTAEALGTAGRALEAAGGDKKKLAEVFQLLAGINERSENDTEAEKFYRKAVIAGNNRARLSYALLLYRRGAYGNAVQLLGKYLASHPDDALGHYLQAYILEEINYLEAAGKSYRASLQAWNVSPAPELSRTDVEASLLRINDKLRARRDEVEIRREQQRVYLFSRMENLSDAERRVKLETFDADTPEWIRAELSLRASAGKAAFKEFQAAWKEYRAARTRAELSAAADSFNAALKKDVSFLPAYLFKGKALLEVGEYNEAVTALEEARRLDEDNPQSIRLLARAYLKAGDYSAALSNARRAVKLEPRYGPAYMPLALAELYAIKLTPWPEDWNYVDVEEHFESLMAECATANRAIQRSENIFVKASMRLMTKKDSDKALRFKELLKKTREKLGVRIGKLNAHMIETPQPGVVPLPSKGD